jgi:hypothetical protein
MTKKVIDSAQIPTKVTVLSQGGILVQFWGGISCDLKNWSWCVQTTGWAELSFV